LWVVVLVMAWMQGAVMLGGRMVVAVVTLVNPMLPLTMMMVVVAGAMGLKVAAGAVR
jgi:hypothetical protein